MISQPIIKLVIALTLVTQSVVSIPLAEATCRMIGTKNGVPILKCTGTSCCRSTDRRGIASGKTCITKYCVRCP